MGIPSLLLSIQEMPDPASDTPATPVTNGSNPYAPQEPIAIIILEKMDFAGMHIADMLYGTFHMTSTISLHLLTLHLAMQESPLFCFLNA